MGFEILTAAQLIARIKKTGIKFKYSQFHHTFRPDHSNFNGSNHMQLQQGMKNFHMNDRGWSDIGQHVSLMPDGKFVTGRPFHVAPAGISGYNTGSFMTEVVGNFDKGNDKLEGAQLQAMIELQAYLIHENGAQLMFHREHAPKSCPGTGIDKGEFLAEVAAYRFKKKTVKSAVIAPKIQELEGNALALTENQQKVVDYLKSLKLTDGGNAEEYIYFHQVLKNTIDMFYRDLNKVRKAFAEDIDEIKKQM
ncbi:N-acetylmuramoyl-L-alanine amidase [Metabacillus sp. 84]|uniref:N-acetylmuramoyl-L-alanine amidase n=1 Tax=Metabacillus sp. 84 TaxID=3404705 RepID=UPI003CF16890